MAFNAATEWEVRTTGSNSNGGGFNTSSTGTDYSQQDSPQVTYTDLVIGATTTQLTSAAHPFTSAHVGNIINITGGTGFTVQRVQINSVSGGVATCDKACGTAGSTGGIGNLGGGLATPAAATALMVAGNALWLQTGSYTLTAQLSLTNTKLIGYGAAHGDNATATLTTATSGINMIAASGTVAISNIVFTTTAASPSNCIAFGTTVTIENCSIIGHLWGVNSATNLILRNSAIIGSTGGAVNSGTTVSIINSYIYGCAGTQLSVNGVSTLLVVNSIIAGGGGVGVQINPAGSVTIVNSTIANNGNSAILASSGPSGSIRIQSNIIYGNGNAGFRFGGNAPALYSLYMANNAWGSNTSGNYSTGIPAGAGDVTLTADPFTNSAAGDFSLNNAAGGGAACKATGFPGAFPGGTTTGYRDIGAVQSNGGGATKLANYSWFA
jgi:hypothetical protein